jgi:hypothetical protein
MNSLDFDPTTKTNAGLKETSIKTVAKDEKSWEELHQKYKEWLKTASVEEIAKMLVYKRKTCVDVPRNARILQSMHLGILPQVTMKRENISKSRYYAICDAAYKHGIQEFIKKQPAEFLARLYGHLAESLLKPNR